MRFLFTAGGTGGHLTPAIAVADQLKRRLPSASILFLTAGRAVDEVFLSPTGYMRVPLFTGDRAPRKTELLKWLAAVRRARAAISEFRPDVVIGLGGYPTLIGGGAALFGRRLAPPLVLLEQNAHVGRAVNALAGRARAILLSMAEAAAELPKRAPREVIGNPLPASFTAPFTAPAAGGGTGGSGVDPREFGLEPGRPTLLVLGGSQGARGVNRIVLAARAALAEVAPDLQILIVAGDTDVQDVRDEVAHAPRPKTVVTAFCSRMRELYQLADVVVARAGGTTLAELAIIGRPMLLVPYPHHKDQHQLANARVFERVGAARIVCEGEAARSEFLDGVTPWLLDPEARQRAGEAARTLGRPQAAADAADRVLAIATSFAVEKS